MADLKSSLFSVSAFSQLIGTVTFKSNYERSTIIKYIWGIITITVLATSIYVGYSFIVNYPAKFLIKMILVMHFFFGQIHVITTWICGIIYQERHLSVLERLHETDKEFLKLGITVQYTKIRKYLPLKLLIHIIVVGVLATVQIWTEHNPLFEGLTPSLFMAFYYLPMFVSIGIVEYISIYTFIIKDRFKMLNGHLEEMQKNESQHDSDFQKLKALRIICPIHLELTEISKAISSIFGYTLLTIYSLNFIAITMGCYLICVSCKYLDQTVQLIIIPETLLKITDYLIYTYYLCYCCHTTVEECTRSGLLLHHLDYEDEKVKDEIQMFSMQIIHENLEFSAGGYFPVNYSLLFSIVGGLTTYIIILIQFSTDSGEAIKQYYMHDYDFYNAT